MWNGRRQILYEEAEELIQLAFECEPLELKYGRVSGGQERRRSPPTFEKHRRGPQPFSGAATESTAVFID